MTTSNIAVIDEIFACLSMDKPQSFFLFAGAGSGKTRTLVEALKPFRERYSEALRRSKQRVAIITYTNAACDEIIRRLDHDNTFWVSTIHSFSWELIKSHQNDIREWLRKKLQADIVGLEDAQKRGRAGTKIAEDRPRQIVAKASQLKALDSIKKFIYNPNGNNSTRDSLNHSEVIIMAADFLLNRSLMQKILVQQFPILLIDESQDTRRELMDAFFQIQSIHHDHFTLGLFGDTMQRIYFDGKSDLGQNIPSTWAKPAITINYRCPKRIIRLINKVRSQVDNQTQEAAKIDEEGFVRLFIADTSCVIDKTSFENLVAKKMAEITSDNHWMNSAEGIKILTLEHHMAAKRSGFNDFFEPLYAIDRLKTGLLDGTLPGISLFAIQILPLIQAKQQKDEFMVCRLMRKYSPFLMRDKLRATLSPAIEISRTNKAVENLWSLWQDKNDPTLNEILKEVHRSGLFPIPEVLKPIAQRLNDTNTQFVENLNPEEDSEPDKNRIIIDAWDDALKIPFSQFENYVKYISDQSRFGTHQGIKGLQFPRVMVILDDDEAKGFLFSYDKLFGAKEPSSTDLRNLSEGTETSIDRTRRLFYVTCSRAEKSLAIIAYTKTPARVKNHVISQQWFEENEVISNIKFEKTETSK